LNAVRCCWPDVQPACKHNRFSERPAAVVSVPTVSVAKTQAELAMAIRPDLMPPAVFVARQLAGRKDRMKTAGNRLREIGSLFRATRTLSEKPVVINRCCQAGSANAFLEFQCGTRSLQRCCNTGDAYSNLFF